MGLKIERRTMTVRGEAYMRTPKTTQKIPTKLDLEAWVWSFVSVTTTTAAMKANSRQSTPITFNCIQTKPYPMKIQTITI